jgi:hypothetical protein
LALTTLQLLYIAVELSLQAGEERFQVLVVGLEESAGEGVSEDLA